MSERSQGGVRSSVCSFIQALSLASRRSTREFGVSIPRVTTQCVGVMLMMLGLMLLLGIGPT